MKDKKGVSGYNYNYQVAIDSKSQMIIYHTLNNEANDNNQLVNMMESSLMSLGEKPKFFVADNGYYNDKAIKWCFKQNINLIIPDRIDAQRNNAKKTEKAFPKRDFKYNRIKNQYKCPQGKILKYKSKRRMNEKIYDVYSSKQCEKCIHLKKYTAQKKREILKAHNSLKDRTNENYHSDLGQEIYKKRSSKMESYFGILKNGRNYGGLKRTGKRKCLTDLTLEAIIHNIKIIHKNT